GASRPPTRSARRGPARGSGARGAPGARRDPRRGPRPRPARPSTPTRRSRRCRGATVRGSPPRRSIEHPTPRRSQTLGDPPVAGRGRRLRLGSTLEFGEVALPALVGTFLVTGRLARHAARQHALTQDEA